MSDKTMEAWKNVKQTQQKYDYFVVGLSSALLAYLGSRFSIEVLSFSQSSFELAALTCFAVSVFFGLLRLESDISAQSIDYRKAQAEEMLEVVNKIIMLPYRNINSDTGYEIPEADATKRQKILNEFITKSTAGLKVINSRYEIYFKVRNYSLFIGFILLVISKYIALLG